MGFPRSGFGEYLGIVTPEEREKWERQRAMREQAKNEKPNRAVEMARKASQPAFDLAQRGITAQMHAAYEADANRNNDRHRVVREYRTSFSDEEPQV